MIISFRSYFDTPAESEKEKEHRGGFSAQDKQIIKVVQSLLYNCTYQFERRLIFGSRSVLDPDSATLISDPRFL